MQKTIRDMAAYIKNIIPVNIPKVYPIKPVFEHISREENIRNGVVAFRDFLFLLCDCLIADDSLDDKPKKTAHVYDHTTLATEYPFLSNIKSILINIGYHGSLSESGDCLFITDWRLLAIAIGPEGGLLKAKISVPKIVESLRFLTCCGIYFDGINLDVEKPDLQKSGVLEISYPDNPVFLTGLKVMAIAQKELYTKGNDNIFLRCDYRVLRDEETDVVSLLEDFVRPLSAKVRDFALKLHQRCLDAGLKCRAEARYFRFRFIYSYKNKEIWAFSASLNYGCRILIKAQNTHQYADAIETFSLSLQEKIAKGYGCEKKRYGKPCQGGCHGFRVPLDDSVLDISRDIELWLDKEVSCLQGK